MLRVITISPDWEDMTIGFTADNTDISADSQLYTADQTEIRGGSYSQYYTLRVPYHFYQENVNFYMKDKLTNEEYRTDNIVASNMMDGTLMIKIRYQFKEGYNFEATIKNDLLDDGLDSNLIWRGRIFSTIQTDLQNYDMNFSDNNLIEI